MKIKFFLLLTICIVFSNGCRIPLAGTHGSMGDEARYQMSKEELEKHILRTIYGSENMLLYPEQDGIYFGENNETEKKPEDWQVIKKAYVKIGIKFEGEWYDLIFRYYGDDEYWKNSKTAAVFLCYIKKKGDKKYKCYYDFNFLTHSQEKYLTDVFEKGFVLRLTEEIKSEDDI